MLVAFSTQWRLLMQFPWRRGAPAGYFTDGLAAGDSPLMLRDAGRQDFYSLDWEKP
jgi:hypothetical protein